MLPGLLMFALLSATSPTAEDTVFLHEVDVVKPARSTGLHRLVAQHHISKNPEQLLQQLSSVYMKNYGLGQLSSLAVRGTNAAQSTVEWNGINLNSVFLGQSDLSLFCIGLHDAYALHPSPMQGQIGGSLGMMNEARFEKRTAFDAYLRYGSFGTHALMAGFNTGNDRWYFRTTVFQTASQNRYRYRDITQPGHNMRTLKNASWEQRASLSQLSFAPNKRETWSLLFWSNHSNRNLPRFFSDAAPNRQQDENLRTQLRWQYQASTFNLNFNSTYLNDRIVFEMPGKDAYRSNSRSHVWRNKLQGNWHYGRFTMRHELRTDFEHASTREYSQPHQRWLGGITSSAAYRIGSVKYIEAELGFREDVVAGAFSPFLPFAKFLCGLQTGAHHLSTQLKGGRNFRYPTFNDWYWQPGGTPLLKPETSWAAEQNISYNFSSRLMVSVTQFYNFITNYIQWQPAGSYWKAVNHPSVFARGIEATVQYRQPLGTAMIDAEVSYTFTRSTATGKKHQLIYIPAHKAVTQLAAQWRGFMLRPSVRFTSERFTASGSESKLPAYALLDVETAKRFSFRYCHLNIGLRGNNLTNQSYSEIEGMPLPGINFEGFLSIQIHN